MRTPQHLSTHLHRHSSPRCRRRHRRLYRPTLWSLVGIHHRRRVRCHCHRQCRCCPRIRLHLCQSTLWGCMGRHRHRCRSRPHPYQYPANRMCHQGPDRSVWTTGQVGLMRIRSLFRHRIRRCHHQCPRCHRSCRCRYPPIQLSPLGTHRLGRHIRHCRHRRLDSRILCHYHCPWALTYHHLDRSYMRFRLCCSTCRRPCPYQYCPPFHRRPSQLTRWHHLGMHLGSL